MLPVITSRGCWNKCRFCACDTIYPDVAIFNITIPYPGSEIFRSVENRKFRREEYGQYTAFSTWHNFRSTGGALAYLPEEMTGRQLQFAQKRAFAEFYLRLKKLIKNFINNTVPYSYFIAGFFIALEMLVSGGKALKALKKTSRQHYFRVRTIIAFLLQVQVLEHKFYKRGF